MRPFLLFSFIFMAIMTLSCSAEDSWTDAEREMINSQGDVMRVTKTDNEADLAILRSVSRDLPMAAVKDPLYDELARKIYYGSAEQLGIDGGCRDIEILGWLRFLHVLIIEHASPEDFRIAPTLEKLSVLLR